MAEQFTSEGYQKKTSSELRTELSSCVTQKCPTFKQEAADIQSNIIDTGVPLLLEIQNIVGNFANSFGPAFSNNFMWEQLAQSMGLEYTDEQKASVLLKFTGKEGDFIPKNTTVTGNFKTNESLTLGSSGEGFITAYSDDESAYQAAGTITDITSTIGSGITVTNPSDSQEKIDGKTSAELKLEAQRHLRNALIGNADYTTALLLATGKIKERYVSFRWLDGKIEPVIGGGDVNEIANCLFNGFLNPSKFISYPSGGDTNRTVSTDIWFYNSKVPIKYTLPKKLELEIGLELSIKGQTINTMQFQADALTKLTNIINSRRVGTPLAKYVLEKPIYDILAGYGIDDYKISKLEWEIYDGSGTPVTFSSDNYLNGVEFDVYTTLKSFKSTVYVL